MKKLFSGNKFSKFYQNITSSKTETHKQKQMRMQHEQNTADVTESDFLVADAAAEEAEAEAEPSRIHLDHHEVKEQLLQRRPKKKKKSVPARWGLAAFVVFCFGLLVWDIRENGMIEALNPGMQQSAGNNKDAENKETDPEFTTTEDENTEASGEANAEASAADENPAAAVFAAYRMDREQSRAEELSLLQQVIDNPTSSESAREQAELRKLAVAGSIEAEVQAESLLHAGGYGETVVLLGADQATVICAVELDAVKATHIAEVVSTCCSINFENVVIVNR